MKHMRAVRLSGLFAVLLLLSCTDGNSPLDSSDSGLRAMLSIAPIVPAGVAAADALPIVTIRTRTFRGSGNTQVAQKDFSVSPTATEWEIAIAIPLTSDASAQFTVELELLTTNGQVEWSSRIGPITVSRRAPTIVTNVPLGRGPLTNLAVTSLTLSGPSSVVEGGTFGVTANVQTSDGSTPRVFFSSSNDATATIDQNGNGVGLTPGTVTIQAASGTLGASISIDVLREMLPDLEALGLSVTPQNPSNTDVLQIDGSFQNIGEASASSFAWQMLVDGSAVASGSVSSLSVGSSTPVQATGVGPLAEGDHTITLEVDSNDEVTESDEDNNETSLTVSVVAVSAGGLAGRVISGLTGEPEVGVTVQLSGPVTASTTTDSNGQFLFTDLPVGFYDITAALTQYVTAHLIAAEVLSGIVTTLQSLVLVPATSSPGSVTGTIVDASTVNPISGATVEIRSGINATAGAPLASTSTSSNGLFSFGGLSAGNYTISGMASGFVRGSRTSSVIGGSTVSGQDIVLSSTSGNSQTLVRIILTWGANPSDLDAHLTGPNPDGSRFHTYFAGRGSLTADPFAQLDVDDTSGFGPETITFESNRAGVFRYSVKDFSNGFSTSSTALGTSGAKVEVFRGSALQRTFFVPVGAGTLWTVFEYQDGEIIVVDALSFESDSGAVPVSKTEKGG